MKRIGLIVLALALFAPAVFAQEEHGEIGVFADYTRLHNLDDANFWGIGARVGFNLNRFVALEGGMAYDFERNFTNTFSNGVTTTFTRSGLHLLHGLFGPKFQTGVGPVRAFVVVKGGFLNFSTFNRGTAAGFTSSIRNVPNGDTNGVFYPGGGIEVVSHWLGIRVEAGDEMYFDNGANHNLKVTAGPVFRF